MTFDTPTSDAAPCRVLATAYACEPGRGSEPGIGWHWARQIARHHELTLITRRNNVDAVQQAASHEGLAMEVVGHDLSKARLRLKRGSRGAMAYYYAWQKSLDAACRPLMERRAFDVAHHLTFASGWIPSGLARLGLPFVLGPVGEHPPVPSPFLRTADLRGRFANQLRRTTRAAVPKLDKDVCATWDAADVILSLGETFERRLKDPCRERVRPMLACGVEPWALAPPSRRADSEPLRVLFAGRLVDLKGVRLALHAFSLVESEVAMTLEFVGGGPERGRLERAAADAGIGDRVVFRGELGHGATLERMRASDIFLFPSFEGAGMVVPEAMASGCALLCLDFGGPGEMARGGRGVAVPLEDSLEATASEIARCLQCLAANEGQRLWYARRGHAWAAEHAVWDRKGAALAAIYAEAREHHRSRSAAYPADVLASAA